MENICSDNPLVSICCTTYNHENYIHKCLKGFMMQKVDFNFEVLIYDDASTDGNKKIIQEYADRYPGIIKPIFAKENQYSKGEKVENFNYFRAKGKYTALCEGDDYWTDPYKLQKQINALEQNSDCGICYTNIRIYDQGNEKFVPFKVNPIQGYVQTDDYITGRIVIGTATVVIKTELIKMTPDLDNRMYVTGDVLWMLTWLRSAKTIFIDEPTAVYRVISTSISHRKVSIRKLHLSSFRMANTWHYLLSKYPCVDKDLQEKFLKRRKVAFLKYALMTGKPEYLPKISMKPYVSCKYTLITILSYFSRMAIFFPILHLLYNKYLDLKTKEYRD